MSSSYLEKFRSALPTVQGNQILRLLTSKRDSGEIKTIDEFKNKLKELTTQLLTERITPTLKLYKAISGQDISSAIHNEMLDRIQDDLEAAFSEANSIDELIEAHHNLIQHVSLKALAYGVNELESKVSFYEFISRDRHGFDDALFNTFRESKNQSTERTSSDAPLLFRDPRTLAAIDSSEDAFVDVVGERLTLGPDTDITYGLKSAQWLSNSDSIRGELDVAFKNSNINNIIDGTTNTFWTEAILTTAIRSDGAPMEVGLYLNATQDINYVELEPASGWPMKLLGIDYFDANNTRQSLDLDPTYLTGITRINFSRVTTSCLVLRLAQEHYNEIQFVKQAGESNFHRAVLGDNQDSIDLESVSDDLRAVLSSEFILSDIMGLSTAIRPMEKYYEYLLGFDNVRIGFSTYDERSIFASKKYLASHPGLVALKAVEYRPMDDGTSIKLEKFEYPTQSSSEDAKFYHSSVEYWLVGQYFSEDSFLISTDTFPLLPLGAERIYHERLLFTKKETGSLNPDIAQLMFYTEESGSDVIIYRNGTEIEYGTDWEFISPGHSSGQTVETVGGGKPMKRAIRIKATVAPLDIYTVSYTPTLANTYHSETEGLVKTVDLLGDRSIRLLRENVVAIDPIKKSYKVGYANFYLVIIMRRNSAELNFSPSVEEYMLVTGSYDKTKFVG